MARHFNRQLWTIESCSFYRDTSETIILPSLAAIAIYLWVPVFWLQLTIAAFLTGKTVAKLLLLLFEQDNCGPKRVLTMVLALSIGGSLIALIPTVQCLIGGRFVEGLGVGCITAISALLIDKNIQGEFVKNWTKISMVNVWVPLIATFIGGLIQLTLGWQANFIVVMIMGCLCLIAIHRYIPTTKVVKYQRVKIPSDCLILFKRRTILNEVLAFSFSYGTQSVIYTITPILFITIYHWPVHFYWVILAFFSGGFFLGKLLVNCYSEVLQRFFCKWLFFALPVLASLGLICVNGSNRVTVLLSMILIGVCGFSKSVLSPLVLNSIKNKFSAHIITGTSFFGVIQSAVGAALAFIAARYFRAEAQDLGWLLFVISSVALMLFSASYSRNG